MKMQKLISKKVVLTVAVFIVASGIAISAFALSQRNKEAPPTASSKDPRTLQEKARLGRGKLVANLDFNKSAQQTSLANMVAASESIAIVTTVSNVCRLSDDGKVVRTFYRVRVEDVLKGHVKTGGDITVSLPGGKVGFPDGGGTAEVQTPWFKKMVNKKRYLLFLTGKSNSDKFTTTGGPQGVFEIPADGSGVLSHSGLSNDVMRQYAGKNASSFASEIKQAIKAQPK
jgi:hypothetical protein